MSLCSSSGFRLWLSVLTEVVVLATQAISNVVKSSFGPSGLDKMMVDDIGVRCFLQ